MRRLNSTVWVHDPQMRPVSFGPGDDVPDWAAKQMGDHCFTDGEPDRAEPKTVAHKRPVKSQHHS